VVRWKSEIPFLEEENMGGSYLLYMYMRRCELPYAEEGVEA